MAWGGGGGMFGGAPVMGGNQPGSPGNGLPFAGIPEELQDGVEKLLGTEPDWPTSVRKLPSRRFLPSTDFTLNVHTGQRGCGTLIVHAPSARSATPFTLPM